MGEEKINSVQDICDLEAGASSPLAALEIERETDSLHLTDADRQFLRDNPDAAEALINGTLELGGKSVSQAFHERQQTEQKENADIALPIICSSLDRDEEQGHPHPLKTPPTAISIAREQEHQEALAHIHLLVGHKPPF